MIDQIRNPVEWALLLTELDEAREHLYTLISEMMASGTIDESEFAVHIGHVFAHLNRAWNSRALTQEIPQEQWSAYSRFPTDLEPVG